ncbi:hypothetical protein [Caulobacter sp. CCUG 60055]|uniref:hypothetical protein n=1 Tax=Caulobacter sp. CCUG 60055 TaxID=2100090 RepID=UPI001FA7A884|nr:hypothetical protein [Caulobacter sp. CCUG 60055]MBQ1543925.1 hypothetical protein [Caulobacteraceae bacterium]
MERSEARPAPTGARMFWRAPQTTPRLASSYRVMGRGGNWRRLGPAPADGP